MSHRRGQDHYGVTSSWLTRATEVPETTRLLWLRVASRVERGCSGCGGRGFGPPRDAAGRRGTPRDAAGRRGTPRDAGGRGGTRGGMRGTRSGTLRVRAKRGLDGGSTEVLS